MCKKSLLNKSRIYIIFFFIILFTASNNKTFKVNSLKPTHRIDSLYQMTKHNENDDS